MTKAIAYLRTSSATNVGADKDSEKRQRVAIEAYAATAGIEIVDTFYDAAVSGADPVTERAGFIAMLDRIAGNGVRTILVESPDRFARDLTVQLTGEAHLKGLGVSLIPTTAPDYFTQDTPTATLIRQVLGAVAQFEKATLVAKLRAARDRKAQETGKCGGRRTLAQERPETVTLALSLREQGLKLWEIAAELAAAGHVTATGKPYANSKVHKMLATGE
jgi:DNA invertase Pin-like site-specific DNA recombinase